MNPLLKGLFLFASFLTLFVYKVDAQDFDSTVYYAPNEHYSFDIPKNKTLIPNTVVESIISLLGESHRPELAVGYYFGSDDNSAYMILTEFNSTTKGNKKQIEKYVNDELMADYDKQKGETDPFLGNFLANVTYNKPTYDTTRNVILLKAKVPKDHDVNLVALSGTFIGNESLVTINFYTPEDKLDQNLPLFEGMIDSFQWQSGYEYKPDKQSFNNVISTLITAGFIGLLGVLFGKNKKTQE